MRDLNIKPSAQNDLFSLPRDAYPLLIEKVKRLQEDPRPDGHMKKKVVQHPNLYRLRAGDFRIFYTFDDGAVYLLAIRRRQEDTYAAHEVPAPVVSGPSRDLPAVPEDFPDEDGTVLSAASETTAGQTAAALAPPAAPRPLPRAITPEWLQDLLIPPEFHPELCRCRHEDDLLDARVPAWVQERVLDNLYPRALGERLAQPDLAVAEAEDLQRYREGDLLGFLLRLDPEQARLVDWAARGPAVIKGGPGSGKSTVALYRVQRILERAAAEGRPAPRILFTTFTNALTRFSEQLLRQLLGERAQQVTVNTADHVARTVLSHVENVPEPADRQSLLHILGEVRSRFVPPAPGRFEQAARKAALDRLRADYLLAEFEWIIEGRGLSTVEEYLRADRTGRGVPLPAGLREAVWQLYQAFQAEVARRGLITYGQIRARALEVVRSGRYPHRYDAVLIDEAQDLTPAALALLTELCRDPGGLFLTADGSQSLYARGFTWAQVHERLRFRGRTALLRRNYRTCREIAEAATAFLRDTGAGDPDCLGQDHVHSGPRPVLHGYRTEAEQWAVVADFIRTTARRLRLPARAAAVLVPTRALGQQAAAALTEAGLPARYMPGNDLDLESPEVKVMTLHSAKGLEFPIVAVLGLRAGTIPRLPPDLSAEEVEEETQAFRRLLFVGLTRAMRALLVCYPASRPSPFVEELDPAYWQVGWAVSGS